ncbi:heterokaryon incompatibility protein-domain-containing protein [Penicillium herquei]|nr:heterokaryon incompatibility protein-domain-containing protein [Penicillium herquei]
MIHLLPSKDTSAPIECTLFNYDLSDGSGGLHIYEALSYCWESNVRSELVMINGCAFPVTKNLHTALLYLRDHQLERTLWVDAICINQDDVDEKSAQIPLMRSIYAQAGQVIVWLGEDRDGGDKALEGIQCIAAQNETTQSLTEFRDSSWKLLQRDWFHRIWVREHHHSKSMASVNQSIQVLQEVGVARSVSIMCGSVQISGHVFCEGLSRLGLPPSIQNHISPVTYLINGASFRPRREIAPQGALHIGELMSMYSKHFATVQHDRIYALLGLSSDAQSTALQPDYRLPWHDVFKNALRHIFPECSIQTHSTGIAVIQGKAWILGHVHSVTQGNSVFGGQHTITVVFNKVAQSLGYHKVWKDEWRVQPTVDLVQEGDFISLFPGTSKPNIVRLCNDHFTIISAAVIPQRFEGEDKKVAPNAEHDVTGLRDTLVTWSFSLGDADPEPESADPPLSLIEKVPEFQELPDEMQLRSNQIISAILDVAVGTEKDPEGPSASKALRQILDQSGIDAPIIRMFRVATQNSESYGNALIEVLTQQQGEGSLVFGAVLKAAAQYTGEYGPETMDFLLKYQGQSLPISEEVVKAAAQNTGDYGPKIMNVLFEYQGQSLSVSEEVFHEAAENRGKNAHEIVKCLLEQHCLVISEEVLKIAAKNSGHDAIQIMIELLRGREQGFFISGDVLKVAATNFGDHAGQMMTILLDELEQEQEQGHLVPEEVLKLAAVNAGFESHKLMTALLEREKPEQVCPISEEVLQAAAANAGMCAHQIMTMLLERQEQKHSCQISEEVLKIAAANQGYMASELLTVLLERQEQEQGLQISKEVVKAVAANDGMYANYLMNVLFEQGGPEQVHLISEEVLKLGAANTGSDIEEMMRDILERLKPEQSHLVTEEVLKIAAANPKGGGFFRALLKHVRNDVAVSEEVIMIAAGNTGAYAYGMMESILDHQGKDFLVSEEVLKQVATNTGERGYIIIETILEQRESLALSEEVVEEFTKNPNWEDMFDALFRARGESVPLTEEVIKAAAENIGEDETKMMEILRQMRQRHG